MKTVYTDRKKSKTVLKYKRMTYSVVTGTKNQETVGCQFFALESEECASFFTLKRVHEGHVMLAHGGVTAAILDETMGYANHVFEYYHKDQYGFVFTGTATYKYLKPVPVGEKMYVYSRVTGYEDRRRFVTGEIVDADGVVYVQSDAVYVVSKELEVKHINVGMLPLEEGDPEEL